MKLVKRRYGRKIANSYLTVLMVLMFSMIFVGNGLGFVLTDPGLDTIEQNPGNEGTDTSSSDTKTNTGNDIGDTSSDTTTQTSDNEGTDTSSSDTKTNTGNDIGDSSSHTTIQTSDNEAADTSSSGMQTNSDTIDNKIYSTFEEYAPNERIVPTGEIESKVEKVFGTVSNGETKEVLTECLDEDTVIEEVKLTPETNLNNVKLTVIKLKDKPENMSLRLKKNESVYCHLDIKLMANDEYVTEDDIKILKFTFKVKKSWIAEYNIDKNTILLIRYHNGEWQNLTTNLVRENDIYVIYEAQTPGCSTFAVIGSALVEIPEPYVTKTPEIPWTVVIGVITSTTIILVTVLFKARYIYFKENPHNIGLKKIEMKNKIGKK
ncbi:MAG: PGF-pre-PGF domain-containing protein [Thermoplasmatales archaeon]|nr:MAG: PGF-pre-PGF domain-containing protein [Thermoplasmatales archaeon]